MRNAVLAGLFVASVLLLSGLGVHAAPGSPLGAIGNPNRIETAAVVCGRHGCTRVRPSYHPYYPPPSYGYVPYYGYYRPWGWSDVSRPWWWRY